MTSLSQIPPIPRAEGRKTSPTLQTRTRTRRGPLVGTPRLAVAEMTLASQTAGELVVAAWQELLSTRVVEVFAIDAEDAEDASAKWWKSLVLRDESLCQRFLSPLTRADDKFSFSKCAGVATPKLPTTHGRSGWLY